ncbi:MAG: transporter substrate-binding domain-containing protein [Micromonosporaceae bacterium]
MREFSTGRRLLGFLGIALSIAMVATGCAKDDQGGASEKHPDVKLISSGKLLVCTGLPYKPFEFKKGGEVVGFDVDLMDLVADELGVKQDIVDTPFEGIKSGQDLNTGRCDAAAAGMTITPEREKVMDFSKGYFSAQQSMLVKAGKPYKSLADLKGEKVGVQTGTTGEAYTREQNEKQKLGLEIVSFEDLAAEQQALASGSIQAAINDDTVWTDVAKQDPDKYELAASFDTGEEYGVAVKKGNKALLKVIDDVIAKAKQDGTYDKIYKEWFGKAPGA